MGAAGCQGLQTGADVTSNPKVPASNGGDRGQANSGGRRGTEAAQQRGNKGRQPMPQLVCQQDICGPEEGWFLQTGCQLEATKSVHGDHTLQDGELGHAERPVTTRRLDGHYRPKGRISVSHNLGTASEVPAFCMPPGLSQIINFDCNYN